MNLKTLKVDNICTNINVRLGTQKVFKGSKKKLENDQLASLQEHQYKLPYKIEKLK